METIEIHPKGWGHEKWIVNEEKYCGKILFFEAGKRCSWHYHKIKDETFYVQSGELMVIYGTDEKKKRWGKKLSFKRRERKKRGGGEKI